MKPEAKSELGEKEQQKKSPRPVRLASKDGKSPAQNPALDLQRSIGNQSVVGLFSSGAIKAKLHVSQPGDPDEIEADRVAQSIVSSPAEASASASTAADTIHRKCSCPPGAHTCPECEIEEVESAKGIHRQSAAASDNVRDAPENLLQNVGAGHPLDPPTLNTMEAALGQDLSAVRIHDNARAAETARSVNARAFTFGQSVAFDSGEYAPHTSSGKRLLAHELTHVVQNKKSSNGSSTGGAAVKRDSWFSESTDAAGKWYDKKKWDVYRGMIAALKASKNTTIRNLRLIVPHLSASLQPAASAILDVIDFSLDMINALLLVIVGLAVGFAEGIVSLVLGLIKLAFGLIKMTGDYIMALMGKPDDYTQDVNDLVTAIKQIPPGLAKIKDQWIERYSHATLEEQVIMGGELLGEIEAFIATFAFAGGKAGQATSITIRGGETGLQLGARSSAAALTKAPAITVVIPAVVPKTATEAAVITSQMMASSGGGPGPLATTAASTGGGSGGSSSRPKSTADSQSGSGQASQTATAAESEESRLLKKYGDRSKTAYPALEWRSIEQLEERFPKLKAAKLRPVKRPVTGGEAIFEERMSTTQSGYSLAGYGSDGKQVIQFDGIALEGFVEEIKIEQSMDKVDEIVSQLRAQADFAREYGLKGVEYRIQPSQVAAEVERRVVAEHLRNVYRR